jgi:hypothetical protein
VLFGLLLPATACRDVAGPGPALTNHRAVYAVIEVGAAGVALLAEEILESGGRGPLRGAQASVSGPSGSVWLNEAALGPPTCFLVEIVGPVLGEEGCYTGTLLEPVGSMEAFSLAMALQGGNEVRGAVVTPEPPVASIPADSQTVSAFFGDRHPLDRAPRAIVPIILHSALGASRVDVVAEVAGVDPAACAVDAWTGPWFAPRLEGRHDWYLYEAPVCREGTVFDHRGPFDLDIHIIAMEENYAGYMNHVLGSGSIDVTRAGFGVEGATGVFGAVASTVLSLRIIPIYD